MKVMMMIDSDDEDSLEEEKPDKWISNQKAINSNGIEEEEEYNEIDQMMLLNMLPIDMYHDPDQPDHTKNFSKSSIFNQPNTKKQED